ncbi:hypothetical protein OC861_005605 [Tilletia horrida]|nr:hypothetical protein OC861_005605 [Tilletia horrida]
MRRNAAECLARRIAGEKRTSQLDSMSDRAKDQNVASLPELDQETYARIGRMVVQSLSESNLLSIGPVAAAATQPAQRDTSALLDEIWQRGEVSSSSASRTQPVLGTLPPPGASAPSIVKTVQAPKTSTAAMPWPSVIAQQLINQRTPGAGQGLKGKIGTITLKDNQIVFLPERLVDQKVDLGDPDLMSLLGKRGCRATVRIPTYPGTSAAVLDIIKNAFRSNKPPVDLDEHGIQFAKLTGRFLVPMPIDIQNVSASWMESTYAKSTCIIVPTGDLPDRDFHRFRIPPKVSKDTDSLTSEEDGSPVTEAAASRPRPRPLSSKKASRTNPAASPLQQRDVITISDDEDDYADHYCFKCGTELRPEDLNNVPRMWFDIVYKEHLKTCPRSKEILSLRFVSNNEGIKIVSMPFLTGESIDGIDPNWLPSMREDAKVYAGNDKSLLPDWAKEGLCRCGEPDSMDNMIQCDACPDKRWYHIGCVRATVVESKRWRCPYCIRDKRPFRVSPAPDQSATSKGKERERSPATSDDGIEPAHKRTTFGSTMFIPRRSTRTISPFKPA